MFNISITNLSDAIYAAPHSPAVLSFIDGPPPPGSFFCQPCHANHLILEFHDIDREIPGFQHPTPAHLDSVLAFTKRLPPDSDMLIHCHAGISRSTAMAIAVLIEAGLSYEEAFREIERVRPALWPNALIVRYTDEHFALGGAYIQLIHDFKKNDLENRIALRPASKADVDEMKRLRDLFR